MTVPCAPFSLLGSLLPTSRFNPGMCWQWEWRDWGERLNFLPASCTDYACAVYKRYGSETIAVVPFLFGRPIVYTSSLETSRAVLDTKNAFRKDEDATQAVLYVAHL